MVRSGQLLYVVAHSSYPYFVSGKLRSGNSASNCQGVGLQLPGGLGALYLSQNLQPLASRPPPPSGLREEHNTSTTGSPGVRESDWMAISVSKGSGGSPN